MLVKPGTFKPFYDKGTDLGADELAGGAWKIGGAPVWGWMSYDPELDLVYYGAGNPSPYNAEQRVGDNKWTASVLARRPSDGSLVWAYQFTPHDNWDYDAVSTMMLGDLKIGGKAAKGAGHVQQERLPVHPRPRDRRGARGAALRARHLGEEHGSQDRPPGARSHQADRRVQGQREGRLPEPRGRSEPGVAGGLLAAHGPLLHLHQQHVHGLAATPAARIAGTPYIGAGTPYHAGPAAKNLGAFMAWDASSGKKSVGDQGAVPHLERRARHRGRRGVLRHARRLVQVGRREDRQGALEVQGRAPASWAIRSPTAAPMASSTWRCTRASAATGSCSRATCAPTIPRTCVRRRIHEGHRAPHQPGRHRLDLRPVSRSGERLMTI